MQPHGGDAVDNEAKAGPGRAGAWNLNRRQFLIGVGAGATAIALGACAPPGGGGPGGQTAPDVVIPFRRRLDQAIIDIEGWNLRTAVENGELVLTKLNPNQDSWIVYRFPPQSILEEAFLRSDTDDDEDFESPPVGGSLSNPSRIAFAVPDEALPLPVTKQALFDWMQFDPSVVPNAVVEPISGSESDLREPTGFETAIELPWHLVLSPPVEQAWAHSIEPVTRDDRTELWHTRLGRRADDAVAEGEHTERMVRAVWSADPGFSQWVTSDNPPDFLNDDLPFRASLTARNRLDIVRLSSDFTLTNTTPAPVEIDRLALTGLGGTLDSTFVSGLPVPGQRQLPPGYNPALLQWRHIANIGRDQYVRVVQKGYLFPWGIRCVEVTISDRIFAHPDDNPTSGRGAYLRQRKYLVITNPVRDLTTAPRVAWGAKRFPFRRIECLTRITPDLAPPAEYVPGYSNNAVYQVRHGNQPFEFHFRGVDWTGERHDFGAMAVFVLDQDGAPYQADYVAKIVDVYNGVASAEGSAAASPSGFDGQKVAFAPEHQPGDTRFDTKQMVFAAELPSTGGGEFEGPEDPNSATTAPGFFQVRNQPRFYPALADASITFSEVASAGGSDSAPPARLGYYPGYLQFGLPQTTSGPTFDSHENKGQVILALPGNVAPATLATSTRNSGGMAAPALGVGAVSRMLGPTAAPGDPGATSSDDEGIAQGKFKPSDILDDSVKILGGIVLVEVLKAVSSFLEPGGGSEKKALRMTSTQESNPDGVLTVIDWEPELAPGPSGLNLFAPLSGASCEIHAETFTPIATPEASTFTITGELKNFVVILFGGESNGSPNDPRSWAASTSFLTVEVQHVRFSAGAGVADSLDCKLGDIGFHGPLKFVEELSELMSFGDGSGIKIDVDGNGILITVTIAIPDMNFGVVSLLNMKVIVSLGIPFDGSPVRFGFAFCSRENPFTLRVWIFGGGGFVGVVVTTKGLEILEFCFEFGAGFQLSIGGLASGKVEIAAGIYFKIETEHSTDGNGDPIEEQVLTLEAYIRIDGKVSVMGLITISVHFHVKLIYTKKGNEELLEGEAVVVVEIEVLVFSGSVELKVRRTISNSSGGSLQGVRSGPMFARKPATREAEHSASTPLALPAAEPPDPLLSFVDNYTAPQWNSYADAFA